MSERETKEWRPFEPCLENVIAATTVGSWLVEPRPGYVYSSPNYDAGEIHTHAEVAKWLEENK